MHARCVARCGAKYCLVATRKFPRSAALAIYVACMHTFANMRRAEAFKKSCCLTCMNSLSTCCCPLLTGLQAPLLLGGDPGGLPASNSRPLLGPLPGKLPRDQRRASPAQGDHPLAAGCSCCSKSCCLDSPVEGRLLLLLLLLAELPPWWLCWCCWCWC